MIYTLSFWGSQGRLGVIGAGELAGRHIFVYPDTIPEWWTMVIEPSPYPDRDGEDHTCGADLVASLLDPLEIDWLERDAREAEIERHLFGRRPLLDAVDWLPEC